MTIDTNTTIRANRLTVKALTNGTLQADLFRTHKHIATINSSDTSYQPQPDANKSAIREGFRAYVADHASEFGIDYDPTDRRTAENMRKASYLTEDDIRVDAIAMITPDIEVFLSKMPHADLITGHSIAIETLTPKTHTSKGTDLSTMGIENGKYASNGKYAWLDIEGTVTMTTTKGEDIYKTFTLELVSGQLKKFHMTQTEWNMDTTADLKAIGLVTEDPKAKAEKSAKAEDAQPTEDKPKTKKSTRSKKSTKEAKAE